AAQWVEQGARRLHLVDLNGAFDGEPRNADVVHAIAAAFPQLPIQIGGGIRTRETVQTYLDAGVQYVIIGTKAITEPRFISELCNEFPGHVIVGIDAKDGKVAIKGWAEVSDQEATEVARSFEADGVSAVVYTDISRDGMMQGVNVEATQNLAEAVNIPIIASGGITNMGDIERLCEVAGSGIMGAITGRAIYEGSLDFAAAQSYSDQQPQN
ncbi:MAG: 1-(5-phosphoribosyl)-5-[(5-phosphoribosylamino)methylideneamino] imidazole-4-carboxamide isomerase, partial [Gammaproteobacteria bacterium]|nr:1-(5-phosphoribosyl)-5-[(5-phosphoribosylamino)methylideneamino] imidazole-4-carboxamide isomerase [Gammaproteobacteria bacterium]